MKLDRLLHELAVSLGEFEAGSGRSSHWESPITLDRISLCSLMDFPEQAALPEPEAEYRGWMTPVADPPVASAIVCLPAEAPEDLRAEFALIEAIANTIFAGADRHQLGQALSYRGSVMAAILATHAPPDSRILALCLGLGPCQAHVYFLCDGKGRRWLEQGE